MSRNSGKMFRNTNKQLGVFIVAKDDPSTNEVHAYKTVSVFTPPILACGNNFVVVKMCKYNAKKIPKGFGRDSWVDYIISFWCTLTFSHNDPKIEHVVYDTPDKLYVIDLELSTTEGGVYYNPGADLEYFQCVEGASIYSVKFNQASFIMSCLCEFYDYPDRYYDIHMGLEEGDRMELFKQIDHEDMKRPELFKRYLELME
jgi:hypothetical protein